MSLAPPLAAPRGIDKRLVLAGVLLAAVAFAFWTGSRYPSLDNKAMMAGDAEITGLAFDRVVEVAPDAPVLTRIGANSVNWAYTNKQGMTFGVLFAALVLTVLPLASKRKFEGGMANTLMGVAMGAPLGVCVNCAVPIAEGIHQSGARGETTLATLMSSPTLNVVVLSMTFALFPFWMASLKLGLTLGFILLVIPLLVRMLWKERGPAPAAEVLAPDGATIGPDLPAAPALDEAMGFDTRPATWGAAIAWTVRSLVKNLWYIGKTTVPLMLLAGLLGAIVVTLLPWEALTNWLPALQLKAHPIQTIATLAAVALLGTFLPVPIAFDVIVCAILSAAGVPLAYVAVLFVTLGTFSAYPFLQIQHSMSRPTAVGLFVGVALLGVMAGVAALVLNPWYETRQQTVAATALLAADPAPRATFPTEALSADAVRALLVAAPASAAVSSADGVTVERTAFRTAGTGGGEPGTMAFTSIHGADLGIEEPSNATVDRALVGIGTNRAAASGDVHGDGWPDLVFTSQAGVSLWANIGGERFVRQEIAVPAFDDLYIADAGLVDLDGDGALDLYVASAGGGNHVVYNDGGAFTEAGHVVLPNLPGAFRSTSTAFGDVNGDGALDIVVGNVVGANVRTPGNPADTSLEEARNALLLNEGGRGAFAMEALPGVPGETLSLLLSDLDGDGDLDLVAGNDFSTPDVFYLGDGAGGFRLVTRQDGIVPTGTNTTMSVVSADLDNDLRPELFIAQIGHLENARVAGRLPADVMCAERAEQDREACERAYRFQLTQTRARDQQSASVCMELDDPAEQADCAANFLAQTKGRNGANCGVLTEAGRWPLQSRYCALFEQRVPPLSEADKAALIPSKGNNLNVLLRRADGDALRYTDEVEMSGLTRTGWTWDTRFADFDQDGWQDLFVVNSVMMNRRNDRDLLFRNVDGRRFENVTETVPGLGSWMATYATTAVDLDLDGDLDLVTPRAMGPVDVFRNEAGGSALQVVLRDDAGGTTTGIGATVIVRYGNGKHQMREIQASGGFLSFDEPVAHFGLGDASAVDTIEVRWSTGETTVLSGPFATGARYTVRRETR